MERERESHSVNPDVEGYLLDETIIGLAIYEYGGTAVE